MKEAASAIKLASEAFESFADLVATKAPKMSEEASKNLAHFMDPKWGKEAKDNTQKDWDTMFDELAERAKSSSDKRLAKYMVDSQRIDDLAKKALEQGKVFDAATAHANLFAEYNNESGRGKSGKSDGYSPQIGTLQQTGEARYLAMVRDQAAQTLVAVRESLDKREEGERELYEKNKAILLASKQDETQYLTENETQWMLYLAKVADLKEKAARDEEKKEEEFQKRIRPFGEKPQSSAQLINRKFEAQQIDLRNAFGDRLDEDKGNPFADDSKLAAQRQYKEKSVALEQERVREINEANQQLVQNSLQNSEAMFGNLAAAARNSSGEQSGVYKTMFAMQKAFAIASAEMSMAIGIGKAMELGWPAGIPAGIAAASEGAKIMAMISSTNFSGAYDLGGDIPAGRFGIVGEYGPEIVRGPANVTGRAATAQMLSGAGPGGGGQPQQQPGMTIVNAYDAGDAVHQYMSSTRGKQVIINHVKQNWRTIRAVSGA
jgi:hypothetical protein